MKIEVVTTFGPDDWNKHASRMVSSFLKNWPEEVNLNLYYDAPANFPKSPRLRTFPHNHPDLYAFKTNHRSRKWRGWAEAGYNYRYDVVKFCHKPFAIWDFMCNTAYGSAADWVMWLDADTFTHTKVTQEALQRMIPDGDFHYLGRTWKYSECGWMMFHPVRARPLITGVVDLYRSGRFRNEREWHDSWLFDVVRARLEKEGTLKAVSLSKHLTREKGGGHPLINTFLGDYFDHLKGPRKATGQPRPGDLQRYSDNPYWSAQKHVRRKLAQRDE